MLNATFFGEIITFGILIFITVKYIWPPIIAAINKRQKIIADGLAAAERGQNDLALAQKKSAVIVEEAKKGAAVLLAQTQKHANEMLESSKAEARVEGERLLQLAQGDIAHAKTVAVQELQQQTVGLVMLLTEKLLASNAACAEVVNQQFLNQLFKEVGDGNAR